MSKVLFALSLVSLLACGSGESNSGALDGTSDTPAVSAAAPTGDDAAAISSCIDLVASGDFEDALPICLEAASIDAENADVQAALAKAQAETASEAATGAAADAAANALGGLGN